MNHPSRNWRRRAQEAADAWLQTEQGRFLTELPWRLPPSHAGVAKRLRDAYLAGFGEGRKPIQRAAAQTEK